LPLFRVVIQVPAPDDEVGQFRVLQWIVRLLVRALRHRGAPEGVTVRVERDP
jgi:hypothetical protein